MASKRDFATSNLLDDKYGIEKITTAEDLDKLISLAEDVSNHLHDMDSKASEVRQKSLWLMGVAYMVFGVAAAAFATVNFASLGKIYEILIVGGIFVSAIPISILFMSMRRNLRKLQNDMKVESSVLQELLSMVHELENVGRYRSTIDPVSSAAFRMRLKRLHFAVD